MVESNVSTALQVPVASVGSEMVFALLPQERAWLAPLLEAVCDPGIAASETKVAGIITEWGGIPDQPQRPEHGAYVAHMLAVFQARLPWLLPLLDAACAMVAVSPGCCSFMTRNRMGETFEIPELLPYTHLLPWVADNEREGAH